MKTQIGTDGLVDLEKARNFAIELNKKGGYWGGRWGVYQLVGWVLHRGVCVYCGTNLIDPRYIGPGALVATDHLLPKGPKHYPDLEAEELNQVPSCSTCNSLKGSFDPSEGIRLTRDDLMVKATRYKLILRATDHIHKNKAVRIDQFELDLANWNEAMRKWDDA